MNKRKILIWTPIATHHQSAFHDAIMESGKIDLQVCYFNEVSKERLALGWEDKKCTKSFEQKITVLDDITELVTDFSERIHIISGNGYPFTKKLIDYCILNNFKWINWTERSGIRLFKLLRENSFLFKFFFPIYQRLYNIKFSKQIEKYALGTFVSGIKAEEDYLRRGVSKEKIKHLYYALDALKKTTITPKELKNAKCKYYFIYVGSLSHGKGIDILLKAYSKLDKNEWGLLLVGNDVSNRKYQEMAKNLHTQASTTFVDAINFDRVNEYMSFANVFVLPTRFDGWGVVINEATSLGMPIISTDQCGAAYHLIEDTKNGFMVKSGSISSLFDAMKFYVDNIDKITSDGKKSLEIFEKFTPKNNVMRLLEALDYWENNR